MDDKVRIRLNGDMTLSQDYPELQANVTSANTTSLNSIITGRWGMISSMAEIIKYPILCAEALRQHKFAKLTLYE